jgi:hypothetical protein
VLAVGLAWLLGGIGLGLAPNSASWWATRPLWMAALLAALAGFVALFGRFERLARRRGAAAAPAWQSLAGAIAVCGGLAVLALGGIGGPGALGIRLSILLLTFAGFALASGVPLPRWRGATR